MHQFAAKGYFVPSLVLGVSVVQ